MKAYLEGATIFREERERDSKDKIKNKHRKENSRQKEPSSCFVSKIKLHSETLAEMPNDHNRRKNHQRVKTDLVERKSHKNEQSQALNKTHSKARLKT